MNRDSNASIIPKIILILGTLSILGIILLFFRPRSEVTKKHVLPDTPEELFGQVIAAATPELIKLWEEGDRFIGKEAPKCDREIFFSPSVGRSYYQCQPHFWQCYWEGGVKGDTAIKVDLFGRSYHVEARAAFPSIKAYSDKPRFYEMFKRKSPGINLHYGYGIEMVVREIPGITQPMVLADTCRDVYLPQRLYGYGKAKNRSEEGFIWDNFNRQIFIDKFYVSNQQANEWRILTHEEKKVVADRKLWAAPALLSLKEQFDYCHYFGKRLLEAKIFDAATMPPFDQKNPMPDKVSRPQTPWQRDLSKSFLGMARINADYQLTPLDCQLAQVQGCPYKLYTTDSTSWMGINYALGFFPESLSNSIGEGENVKLSSRFLPPHSEWHELGLRSEWKGEQEKDLQVAFRCYEEVSP